MKTKNVFTCQSCGYQSPKWLGRCPDCSKWNSFAEEDFSLPEVEAVKDRINLFKDEPVLLGSVEVCQESRLETGIKELDRVLGGGIVQGSVILVGGDPGIGKSTISLQVSKQLAAKKRKVLYVSGEESISQTKLRAKRLGASGEENVYIVSQTDLFLIIEYIRKISPDVVIIDSIQVVFHPAVSSSAGSVSQVRECAGMLTQLAKSSGTSVFIIGHVTKEGTLAGPRVLEHIVDTVLYFEGDRFSAYRILRAVKNRFGSTNEIGVFQMRSTGLVEVSNPSEIFLSEMSKGSSGSVVASVLEGSRPLLVEIQALVSRSNFGYPQRKAQGFDLNRLSLLVAVLDRRLGLHLEAEDIFVNVAGGIKIQDPSVDLAVALAVSSGFYDKPVMSDTAVLGEVGLAGEIRSISQAGLRVNEAEKLGFKHCILPAGNFKGFKSSAHKMELVPVSKLKEAVDIVLKEEQ